MAFSAANCPEAVYFSSFKHLILDYHEISDVEPMQEHIMCTTIYYLFLNHHRSGFEVVMFMFFICKKQQMVNGEWQTALHNKRAESEKPETTIIIMIFKRKSLKNCNEIVFLMLPLLMSLKSSNHNVYDS